MKNKSEADAHQEGKDVKKQTKTGERSHRYSAERKTKMTGTKSQSNGESKQICETNETTPIVQETKNLGEEKPTSDKVQQEREDQQEKQEQLDEEKSRLEEERMKQEEEKLKLEEEQKQAVEAKALVEERIANRLELREKNLNAHQTRPYEDFFKQLDSSMKKNTAFVKKLKSINEQQKDSLVAEFNGLNLNKFIQEAVTSIVEAKLKVSDVSAAAYICSLFHQRYSEFTQLFQKSFLKIFDVINCKDDEKSGYVSRLRTSLRLLGELILDGVFAPLANGVQMLSNILQTIISSDKSSYVYAPVVLTIVRHCGEDLAGLITRKYRHWKELINIDFPVLQVLTKDQQSMFMCLFKEYYENMCKHLVVLHKDIQNREKQNRQTMGLKGELSAERKEACEKLQKVYEKLLASTSSLAELLDEDMPDLPVDECEEREELGTINIFTPVRGVEYDSENGLWEDEDTRKFYEDIKDLQVLVPQILFKETPTSNLKKTTGKNEKKKKERKLRVDLNLDDGLYLNDYDEPDDNYEQDILGDDGDEEEPAVMGMAAVAEAYFQKLPTCVNRDFIDQAAEEFIMKLNTKGNRKKLVRALFTVNRVRLDLLPFYSRLVATLSPCLPDIATDLVWLLKGSFRAHLRKKDQIHCESKIKTIRFIGELAKFKVCPKAETLHCLKLLLENFTHHNIDMTCNLLETCGRFLYRSPESNPRMLSLLDQMKRKKSVQAFDSRHLAMIENALYYCDPPERQQIQKKVRPPLHEYIRKLLYKDLSKTTTEKVLRQIRKLPWSDEKVKSYVIKCLLNVWNVKFNNIRCLANLLSGLAEYHDDVAVAVIDGVLENIRLGMETNLFRDNQRRLSCGKYVGEMYNYQLVDSDIIFKTLYLLITFGACLDMSESELDPPDHLFRIRLVCTILDSCGQYFDRGSSKKKLDYFLVYFQSYVWNKRESGYFDEQCPFPKDVEYMINDSLESLRPKLHICTCLEEANAAANQLSKEYEAKIKALSSATTEEGAVETGSSVHSNSSQPASPYAESPIQFSPGNFSQSSHDDDGEETSYNESANEDEEGGDMAIDTENEDMFVMENEDEVKLNEAPKYVECEEDDFFRKDFDRMMGDSITERLHNNMKIPNVDIAIPMNLKGKKKRNGEQEKEVSDGVNFVIMLKKNNKQVLKDLNIPLTSDLAANIRNKQDAERLEHEEMKRLVLDYNQRQEEESYHELMSQFRPPKRGGHSNYRPYHQGGGKNHRGGNSRLRSRDAEQHLFSPSNRR